MTDAEVQALKEEINREIDAEKEAEGKIVGFLYRYWKRKCKKGK